MAFEEKRAWILLLVAVGGYAAYAALLLGRWGDGPLSATPYVALLLKTNGVAIAVTVALVAAAAFAAREDAGKTDVRDREIARFGEWIGNSLVVAGALAAMGMAMGELAHFWIANALYLAFVLAAILGSIARIVAYRRGFQT